MRRMMMGLLAGILCITTACTVERTETTGGIEVGKLIKEYEEYITHLERFPISFQYEGKQYRGFDESFTETNRVQSPKASGGTVTEITLRHTPSGTDFRLETSVYGEYSAYEWTVWITNNGTEPTGLFHDIQAIDMEFKGSNPIMKGISGDLGKDMYSPYEVALEKGITFSRQSTSGRPTHGVFPYFNLEYGNGGSFIAIGWPGCWKAEASSKGTTTRFTGGQYEISTVLAPGETIRTPLVALVKYSGRDELTAMNLWRRWFIDCNMRKVNGENMPPLFTAFTMCDGSSTKTMKRVIQGYADHGVPLDCYWMDAGWYTDAVGNTVSWPQTGTLLIDESRFPDRFASITEEIEKNGGMTLLWFEPEVVRVDKKSFLKNTPDFDADWMLGTAMAGTWLEGQLLDMGNADCREWLLTRIVTILKEGGISIYRQDFNVDPAPVWRNCEGADRIGYVENQYVIGYLAFWDGLLEQMPEIWIDSCASGGGRNDLETMRRGVPSQISDYWDGNDGGYDERQATMMSVMQWLPYIKFWMYGEVGDLTYRARSCYTQIFPLQVNVMSKDTPWDTVKMLKEEWESISVFFYADFYPLMKWNNADDLWRGYEYFDPDRNAGFAQLFRPEANEDATQTIRFHGLQKESSYRIYDTDGLFDTVLSGRELMEQGLPITLPHPLYAMVIHIQGL